MSSVERKTKETDIKLDLKIYAKGQNSIKTGVGFFDHMLEAFSKHSLIDMDLDCKGDLHVDAHHCVEDVGIVIGQALKEEIYPVESIERFSDANVVMDEALVNTTIDLSNRPYLHYDVECEGMLGEFDCQLAEEFFRALCLNAKISAHIVLVRGSNKHHIIEATFKSFAIALRRALTKNSDISIPSTKGLL